MQIYSPSSREEYSFCPRSWWLRKNGWVPRMISYPELCGMGGSAVGKAMEVWNRAMMAGNESSLDDLLRVGYEEFSTLYAKERKHGRNIGSGKDHEFFESLPPLIEQAIRLLYRINPLKPYAILGAELEFPQAGKARLDVLVKQADERRIVFDYKVKFNELEEKWVKKEFEKHFTGEQRLTYTTLTQTDMFGIILIVLKPKKDGRKLDPKILVQTSPVTDQEKQVWLRDAQLTTEPMTQTLHIQSPTLVSGKTFPHVNQYGDCKYHDACLRYGLDEGMMRLDYLKIEKEN